MILKLNSRWLLAARYWLIRLKLNEEQETSSKQPETSKSIHSIFAPLYVTKLNMTAASLADIRKELQHTNTDTLQALCLRLARYKKENKELLNYLLFEAHDESGYIQQVKTEVELMFDEIADKNLYLVKKILRKILRFTNRQIKYSGLPQTELELRIFFCEKVVAAQIPLSTGTVLYNLYQQQLKKIGSVLTKLPEDLQGDYTTSLKIIRYE